MSYQPRQTFFEEFCEQRKFSKNHIAHIIKNSRTAIDLYKILNLKCGFISYEDVLKLQDSYWNTVSGQIS